MPLGIILFDFLFLILAIPIEACVLKNTVKNLTKKSSVFYATSINIFANISGWLIFFFVEPYLSPKYKSELLSYVFFNLLSVIKHI
ncbi:filament integrity protein FraC [Richelia intracellularis]|uniref:filament integrity protein FraC n=1 Tax=Richelia intracellularis TaxID=1164990 RepID=UPI0039C6DC2D